MQHVLIRNLTNSKTRPIQACRCSSFLCRLRGLMFYRSIKQGQGLLLVQPRANRLDAGIHMFFMNFDITAVWLDDDLRVVEARHCRRWRPAYLPAAAARYVLETHAAHKDDFQTGDQLSIEPC